MRVQIPYPPFFISYLNPKPFLFRNQLMQAYLPCCALLQLLYKQSLPDVYTMITPRTINRMAMISCSPSTINTAVPAPNAFTRAMVLSTSAVKVTQSMMISGGNRVLFSLPVTFKNTHKVIRTSALNSWFAASEQRPDVGISNLC